MRFLPALGLLALTISCQTSETPTPEPSTEVGMEEVVDTSAPREPVPDNTKNDLPFADTVAVSRFDLVDYAKTLQGVPYKYASTNPTEGFDCSGFITYVFNHFRMSVPRSSVDFTNYGRDIPRNEARPGDLILFTGTDSTDRTVGHMGIVVSNTPDSLHFIHSTSGSAYGVTITPLNGYYLGRFVKTIEVLP